MELREATEDDEQGYRKWLITLNNPEKHGYTIEKVTGILKKWKGIQYWCFGSEIGVEEKTPHYHFFIYCPNKKKFETVKNKFPQAHLDIVNGTSQENKDYCWKVGKWKDTEKGTLHDYDSNQEGGEMPEEKGRGYRSDYDAIWKLIKEGKSNIEIIEEIPQAMKMYGSLDRMRQDYLDNEFGSEFRKKEVVYAWGLTGTGKTKHVVDLYGYKNIFRVTDYKHPFDGYRGQDVLVFEEFRGQIEFSMMLDYLDGHPCELQARYNNKIPRYTKVFMLSNRDLREQYQGIQELSKRDWNAFLRRIDKVRVFMDNKGYDEYETQEYIRNEWRFIDKSPFDKESEG